MEAGTVAHTRAGRVGLRWERRQGPRREQALAQEGWQGRQPGGGALQLSSRPWGSQDLCQVVSGMRGWEEV